MAEYISRVALMGELTGSDTQQKIKGMTGADAYNEFLMMVNGAEKADVSEERRGKLYSAHEVAEILAEAIGDKCACNVNGNDEWLPEKCELLDACPNPVGVACWEQWLKWKDGGADNGE